MTRELAGRVIAQVLATSTGGVGTHVRGLVPALRARGAEVRVLGPQATQDLFAFSAGGARFGVVDIASSPRPGDATAARDLRRATRDADLVHAHGLRAGTVAALANFGRRTPLVVTLHNLVSSDNPLRRTVYAAVERFVARSADVVLGASSDLVERARAVGGRDVRLGPVGAPPLPAPTQSRVDTRAALGLDPDVPVVLSVGRLHPQKGYDVLVRAAARWAARPVPPVVLVAGDGPLHDELMTQIAQTGAPVRLLGRRTDIADLIEAADVVALPSRWEARSLTAQEAMRAGRALVTTTPGGMAQLVGAAARTIPTDDDAALATAVGALLDDPAERDRLGAAAGEWSRTWPSEAETATALTALYVELLGRPASERT